MMKQCPECKGKKGYSHQLSCYWEEPRITEWVNCPTCKGKGEISELALAIYEARGGPAPPNII
jgi:DnaJ-class molecular chaperone